MSKGTEGDYWKLQALPSRLKHTLLKLYIPRFGAMTGAKAGRVIYLDGYAGEGRYESGEPGSAAIAMKVAADHLAMDKVRWSCYFAEKQPESFARLNQVAADYRAEGVDARVFNGDVEGVLGDVLPAARGLPLFLFLDPCGMTVPFDRLATTLNQRRSTRGLWQPTELLMNFSMDAVRRIGGHMSSPHGNPKTLERFDAVCGGPWWREHFPADGRRAPDAAERVAAAYADRLGKATDMLVQSIPVSRKPGQEPIYHLVFGTRSPYGLWLFGDAAARARDAWWEGLEIREEHDDPDALFSAVSVIRPDPKEVTRAAIPDIAQNLARLLDRRRTPIKLVDYTLEVFGEHYGQVTDPAVRKAIERLNAEGGTPTTGRGSPLYKLIVEPPSVRRL